MQNEANSPIADFGLRIADSRQTCGGTPPAGRRARGRLYKQTQLAGANRAKRTQFPGGAGWGEAGGTGHVGQNAQNEPNFLAGPGGTGPGRRGTRDGMCETNPICTRGVELVGQAPPYKEVQLGKTNPVSEGVFKFEVSSVKLEKSRVGSSCFRLHTWFPNAEFRVWGPFQTFGGTPAAQRCGGLFRLPWRPAARIMLPHGALSKGLDA